METLWLIVIWKKLLLALSSGLVVWVERHISKWFTKTYVWMRDFMLISILAFLASYFNAFNQYIWPIAFLFIIAVSLTAFIFNTVNDKKLWWTTTLLALPVVFLVSSISMQNFDFWLIATLVFVTLIILELKSEWYDIATTFTRQEILDFSVFIAIAIIVTPLIPAHAVIDLWFYALPIAKIWKVVILVSMVSFVWHFVWKHIKWKNAILIASFFWWLVSSLATIALFMEWNKNGEMKRRNIMLAYLASASWSIAKDILLFYSVVPYVFFQKMLLPLVWMLVTIMAWAVIMFAKSDAEAIKITDRPMPLKFIFKFSWFLVAIIIIMAGIAKFLPDYFSIASFFSWMASSGSAIVAIWDTMSQGMITAYVAWISLVLAVLWSTFAKYLVIAKWIWFLRSWMFFVPIIWMTFVGLWSLYLALQ